MKKLLVAFLILISPSLFAAARFDAKTWKTLQTYDVRTLSKDFESHIGELVEIRFNFRGKDIHHQKSAFYQSSIWQPDPESRKHFADVKVMVAHKDIKAFKALPTDGSSAGEMIVYGRVLRDSDAHYVFVRLIGRNVAMDSAGTRPLPGKTGIVSPATGNISKRELYSAIAPGQRFASRDIATPVLLNVP